MLSVKSFLKRLLAPYGMRVISGVKSYVVLRNVYGSRFERRVLISYINEPFLRRSLSHTNFYEVTLAAKIFDGLGYCVDVMHYEGRIPRLDSYHAIYGFGDVFKSYFESGSGEAKTIYYGTGMHVCHQNNATLMRVKDVYKKKSVWLCRSARYVEKTWSHQTVLVDGIIALGNERCAETYRKHYDGPVLSCPAPFFQTLDYRQVMRCRKPSANRGYLWFGSVGLIHKGLDLCLEYFQENPDLDLHVCGDIYLEPDFVNTYRGALFGCSNIHVHGFVSVQSDVFSDILSSCAFTIFPSCSEGGAASVLTAVGNGALIPVVSRESSVTASHGVIIQSLTPAGFAEAMDRTRLMSDEKIKELQVMSANSVIDENSLENYERVLKAHITSLLEE